MIVRHYLVARDGHGKWWTVSRADGPAARHVLSEHAHRIQKDNNRTLARIGRQNRAAKGQRVNTPATMLRGFRIITTTVMETP